MKNLEIIQMDKPIILNGPIVYFDIDDTLVTLNCGDFAPGETEVVLFKDTQGNSHTLGVFRKHVEAIKMHHIRGHKIVLWSRGGANWAYCVANALKIVEMVSLFIDKPTWFYDDLPASKVLRETDRYYLYKGSENEK